MEDLLSAKFHGFHSSPDPCQPGRDDLIIAVMGVTGAGKSTFISHCTPAGEGPLIGHGIQSCTRDVSVYKCDFAPGTSIYLVDTPGFNDTSRTDKQVLREISAWLGTTYEQSLKLSGIIYFHPISDRRMTGSARRNLLMFQKLCGEGALARVILATTMWENMDQVAGKQREATLVNDFWSYMRDNRSQVVRHYDNRMSAMNLLGYFASTSTLRVTLDIQQELVDGHHTLDQTVVRKETIEGQGEEMANLIGGSQQEVREMEAQIQQLQQDRDDLRMTFKGLQKQARSIEPNTMAIPNNDILAKSTPINTGVNSSGSSTTSVRYGYSMSTAFSTNAC